MERRGGTQWEEGEQAKAEARHAMVAEAKGYKPDLSCFVFLKAHLAHEESN